MWSYMKFWPVVQKEMSFKDISYLEIRQPIYSVDWNHLLEEGILKNKPLIFWFGAQVRVFSWSTRHQLSHQVCLTSIDVFVLLCHLFFQPLDRWIETDYCIYWKSRGHDIAMYEDMDTLQWKPCRSTSIKLIKRKYVNTCTIREH